MNSAHMSTIQLQKHSDVCGLSLQEQLQVEMISRSYVEIIQYGTSTCTESSGCCSIRWEGDWMEKIQGNNSFLGTNVYLKSHFTVIHCLNE